MNLARYLTGLAPVPGLAILAWGVATFYFYYDRFAFLGDSSALTAFLLNISSIVTGAALVVLGTDVWVKWSKLRVSVIFLRKLVPAFGLILVGFVFVIIELATDTLVCVRYSTAGFVPESPSLQCLEYGYAHQFLWLGFLGSGMVVLGVLVSGLEQKRQFNASLGLDTVEDAVMSVRND